MKVKMNVKMPIIYLKEGKSFVAYAPALDLSSAGNSLKKAEKNIKEATELFIEEVYSRGTMDEVLYSLGWKKALKTKQWKPPVFISHGLLPVTV